MKKKRIKRILRCIDKLRAELELLYEEQGLDEEVVRKSQILDKYIVEYYRLTKEI